VAQSSDDWLWQEQVSGHIYRTRPGKRRSQPADASRREQLGVVLRTRANVKPVFISPGHLADLDTSIEPVLNCTPKHRLPEPIHQAHNAAGRYGLLAIKCLSNDML
jgi:deoxyribonuclease V